MQSLGAAVTSDKIEYEFGSQNPRGDTDMDQIRWNLLNPLQSYYTFLIVPFGMQVMWMWNTDTLPNQGWLYQFDKYHYFIGNSHP